MAENINVLVQEMARFRVDDPRALPDSSILKAGYPSKEAAFAAYSHHGTNVDVAARGPVQKIASKLMGLFNNPTTISPTAAMIANSMQNQLLGANKPNNPSVAALQQHYGIAPKPAPKPIRTINYNTDSFQDTDKANRARIAPKPAINTSRGQDSWDRGNGMPLNAPPAPVADQVMTPNFDQLGLPNLPVFQNNVPPPPQFDFKLNDFSQKANQMAAQAYAPEIAAIDRAKKNVDMNYQQSSKIVQGLYNNLLGSIAKNTAALNDQYAGAQTANQQTGADTRAAIGQTYASSQNQLADLINKIGGGTGAAAAVLPNGLEEQAYQQSRSLNNQQSNSNFLNSQQQAAQDYQTQQQQAQATQGAFNQQELLRQKSNDLQNWDWRGAQLAGQQAQQALQLGQDMQGRDLNLQQLNYGAGQDLYKNLLSGQQITNDQAQQDYQNRFGQFTAEQSAKQAAIDAIIQQQKLNSDQTQADFNNAYKQAQLELERQRLNSSGAAKPDPGQAFDNLVGTVFPANSEMAKSAFYSILSKLPAGLRNYASPDEFARYVRDQVAQQPNLGLDPDSMARVAQAYILSDLSGWSKPK